MKKLMSTVFPWAILALPMSCCFAAQAPSCPSPAGAKTIRRMSKMPSSVSQALKANIRDIVDSNQPFDDLDVVRYGGHFNRFAFAWEKGSHWVVVTEHGGIAYSNPIYVFHSDSNTKSAKLITSARSYHEPVCKVANQLLLDSN
jgi:hypothetical protein